MATWNTVFNSAVIVNNMLTPNSYSVSVQFEPITSDMNNISIFIQRMKTFFEIMKGSTIIGTDEEHLQVLLEKLEAQWVVIPSIPYDAIIAEILHAKLSEISEGNVEITSISVSSSLSDDVILEFKSEYTYTEIEVKNPTDEIQPWYFQNNVDTVGIPEEIVSWEEFGLTYEAAEPVKVATKRMGLRIIDGGRPKGVK
jgi:hypothetical protein